MIRLDTTSRLGPKNTLALAAAATVLVVGSRVRFRSHFLYSWDSANFALALDQIDIASDLQALTVPTAHTVATSDARIAQLQGLVRTTCAEGNPVIIAGNGDVDWRRVMWYFPSATAVRMADQNVRSSATNRRVSPIHRRDSRSRRRVR